MTEPTYEGFLEYLTKHLDERYLSCNPSQCPAAHYVRSISPKNFGSVGAYTFRTDPMGPSQPSPRWLQAFIRIVDRRFDKNTVLHPQTAIAVLELCQPAPTA